MTALAAAAPITLWVNGGEMKTTVSLTRAIRLLYTEKAEIVEAHDGLYIRSASGEEVWPMPKILRLVRHVKLAYDKLYGAPMVSKRGVLIRDNHVCAYCGGRANTVDHVHPRSKGGKTTWENLVAACRDCNNRKRDHTLAEMGWTLKVTPHTPKRKSFVLT